MAELYPTDAELNALSGVHEAGQEVYFPPIGESPYYTSFYRMLHRLILAFSRSGDLRVYKDGDLTFGVRAGRFVDDDTARTYAGSSDQALTDDATNYVYLLADGTLTVSQTDFPVPSVTPHIRLARIVCAGGMYAIDDITDFRATAIFSVLR